MKCMKHICLIGLLMLIGMGCAYGQSDRDLIRLGNRDYKTQKWAQAETQYRKAVSKNERNAQAIYNIGCALMMQEKDSMAMLQLDNAAKLETSKLRRAKSYHNMGTIMQKHQQYGQAIEYYKMALRNNPSDNETRYNLALCKKLLKNQPQQNQQGKGKDDKNNKDKKNNNEKNNKDKNSQDNKKQDRDQKQERQNQEKMSKDNAEQLLNAAIQQEKSTKQRLQKAMRQPRRNVLDKNW